MIPATLGGQSGAALPPGTPNYFVSESQTAFAFEVRKFTAGPNCGAGGTLSSPVNVSQTSYNLWADPFAPHSWAVPLSGERDRVRIRQGDWRGVVLILRPRDTVILERVGHRSEVYR